MFFLLPGKTCCWVPLVRFSLVLSISIICFVLFCHFYLLIFSIWHGIVIKPSFTYLIMICFNSWNTFIMVSLKSFLNPTSCFSHRKFLLPTYVSSAEFILSCFFTCVIIFLEIYHNNSGYFSCHPSGLLFLIYLFSDYWMILVKSVIPFFLQC